MADNTGLQSVVQRMIDAGESEENIASVIKSAQPAKVVTPSDATSLGMAASAGVLPGAARLATEVVTNPNLPKMGANAGRLIGGVAPTLVEAAQGNGMGALTAAALSGKTAWAGSKAGWFTAKLAQQLGIPVAKVAEAIAPYAAGLSTLSGAQGVNDLAQMAEPNRSDIGIFGIGKSNTDTNSRASIMISQINALVSQGLSLQDASKKVQDAWKPKK